MADEAGVPGAEYPKMLYRGGAADPKGYNYGDPETVVVADADEEAAARKDGYAVLGETTKAAKAAS